MRTTLTIDDDAMSVARSYARDHGISLGEAVSKLILKRHGGSDEPSIDYSGKFPSFKTKRVLTVDIVREILEDE